MKYRLELNLDSEIVKQMRAESIQKYGNLRSMSKLIEELYTSKNLPVKEPSHKVIEDEFSGTHIVSHNGTDIGGMNPNLVQSKLMLVSMDLKKVADMRERKGRPAEDILEDIKFVNKLMLAVMDGMCDGSLDRHGWCPGCEGYIKNADGTYSFGDGEYAEGAACEIRKN